MSSFILNLIMIGIKGMGEVSLFGVALFNDAMQCDAMRCNGRSVCEGGRDCMACRQQPMPARNVRQFGGGEDTLRREPRAAEPVLGEMGGVSKPESDGISSMIRIILL